MNRLWSDLHDDATTRRDQDDRWCGGCGGTRARVAGLRHGRQRAQGHHHVRLLDDGEPQLRPLLRVARVPREQGRQRAGHERHAAGPDGQPGRAVQARARQDVRPGPAARLGRAARVVGHGQVRPVRRPAPDGAPGRDRSDAVPDARLSAGQLRARRRVHELRRVVRVGDGPDVAEPLLLDDGELGRPDGQHAARRWRVVAVDLQQDRRQGRRLGLLLRLDPGRRRGKHAERAVRARPRARRRHLAASAGS